MADSPVDDQSVSVAQELDTSMEKLKRILTIQALSTRPVVQNYQCASFFATVCCFMPLGIWAFVKLGDAQEAKERGDTLSAERHTREAKKMVLLSVVMMVVLITICTILSSLILLLVSRKLANAEDALADRTKNHTGV